MGSSTVVTHLILFIAVLGIATGLIITVKNYIDQTEGTFKEKSNDNDLIIKTNIKIEVISYNNNTNTTWIYVRNTGQSAMKPAQIDMYIDGIRLYRDNTNRTIELLLDTDLINVGIWDPKEQLLIKAFKFLNNTITHEVIIATPYSVSDSETFSI
jgi:archaellum component FlaF (FlaF/FlaG flagellin family)